MSLINSFLLNIPKLFSRYNNFKVNHIHNFTVGDSRFGSNNISGRYYILTSDNFQKLPDS